MIRDLLHLLANPPPTRFLCGFGSDFAQQGGQTNIPLMRFPFEKLAR
jgi:hypothetical protein